jgi:hypothetical protein
MTNTPSMNKYFWSLRILYGWDTESVRPKLRVTVVFGLLYISGFMVCYFDNTLVSFGRELGYLSDYANYFLFLGMIISFSLIYSLRKKFVYAFMGSEGTLVKGKGLLAVVNGNRVFWDDYQLTFDRLFSKICLNDKKDRKIYYSIQVIIAIVYIIAATIIPLSTKPSVGNWNFSFVVNETHFFSYLWCQGKDFLFYVIFIPSALWQVIIITYSTMRLIKYFKIHESFQIIPLSPDNAGGLKPLGEISLLLFYIVIVQIMHIIATELIRGISIHNEILFPIYILFAALVFFLPLGAVHSSMKRAKRDELERISKGYNQIYYKFRDESNESDANQMKKKDRMEEMQSIKELYHQADQMPVWPYDLVTISKFLSMFLLPLGVLLTEMLTNAESIIYKHDNFTKLVSTVLQWLGAR